MNRRAFIQAAPIAALTGSMVAAAAIDPPDPVLALCDAYWKAHDAFEKGQVPAMEDMEYEAYCEAHTCVAEATATTIEGIKAQWAIFLNEHADDIAWSNGTRANMLPSMTAALYAR